MTAALKAFVHFWTTWLGGIAMCGIAATILAVAIVFGGIYNTGADDPHLKLVARAIHQTMISSVRKRATTGPELPPITRAKLQSGTKVYESHCIACHGGPGVSRAPWAAGLLPTPPYLIDSRTRWTRAELRELVAHGVKMSAMPAWGYILPAKDIDDVVALLEVTPSMTTAQFNTLRVAARALPTTPLEASGPGVSISPLPLDKTRPLSHSVEPAPTVRPRTMR